MRHNIEKNILCIETGKVYCSTIHAAERTGANQGTISNCCRGRKKSSGGYHWRYTDQPITETRECICGKEYLPTSKRMSFCCKECKRKAYRYDEPRQSPEMCEFTFTTNMMIVRDNERWGNFDRLSEATMRSKESLARQCEALKADGQYDKIVKMLNIKSELLQGCWRRIA